MKKVILILAGLAFLTFRNQAQTTVSDIDGNVYHTVKIGKQVWMVENLKNVRYRNGDSIPKVKDKVKWGSLSTGAYSDYNNHFEKSADYGRLYNWYAVNDSRNLAPTGWHVATEAEWAILTTFLNGENVNINIKGEDYELLSKVQFAGGKLKETGTTGKLGGIGGTSHWFKVNSGASNEFGFTALPGGERSDKGGFHNIGCYATWWTSTENREDNLVFGFLITGEDDSLQKFKSNKKNGYSIRCVKDE